MVSPELTLRLYIGYKQNKQQALTRGLRGAMNDL
jgi:hypothetical protein